MFQRAPRLPTFVLGPAAALALAVGCRTGTPVSADRYDPARDLGPLFHDVQLSGIFADSKTFVDARPRLAPATIVARSDLVRNMLDNFAYLVQTVGHIPNGNRTYYLSRSQPPFFAAMVGLYARATDTTQALRYLDALEAEYAFWMDGAERLGPAQT